MTDAGKWDRVFGAFGGRIFTLGVVFIAVAVLTVSLYLSPRLFGAPRNYAESHHGDIDQFIRAGALTLAGRASDAYNRELFAAPFNEASRGLQWYYPPHAFLFAAPLGALPYPMIRPLWIALTIGAMAVIGLRAGPRGFFTAPALVFSPACFAAVYFLQASAFVAAGLTAALLLARRRPAISGIILGVLTIKPQYGLMAPVFLLASNNKRAFITALAVALFLAAASTAEFGAPIWKAFYESMRTTHTALALQAQLGGGMSALQFAVKLGGGAFAAFSLQIAVILIAAACVVLAQRQLSHHGGVAVALLASVAAAPSAWIYDWPFVVAALAFYSGDNRNWNTRIQIAALALWITVLFPMFGVGGDRSIVAPLALLGSLIAIFIFLLRKSTAQKFQSAQ